MADIIHTKKRDYKYNGPVDSSDYNARIEENYKDLVYLYNKASLIDAKLADAFERVLKDHIFLSSAVQDLEDRIGALEAAEKKISIHSFSQVDYASLAGSSFAISGTELLHFDPVYNIITLPKVESSSYSKLKFSGSVTGQIVPDFFKAKVDTSFAGVDTPGAIVDSTPIYNALLDSVDKFWTRTVIANTPSSSGAQMMLYLQVPSEVSGSLKTNIIKLNPYPAFGVDIASIEYTTKVNPTLDASDGWLPLNRSALYDGESDAIGKVAPGGWDVVGSDKISNSGPLAFIFPDTDITGLRIKMNQRSYFTEQGKAIYTYGLADLDVGFNKYLPTGRTAIKFTPADGSVINNIVSVNPKIYNVPRSLISTAFSHRVIYENGGVYSLTNPGASNSVWIEVTLNMLDDKTAPVLSDLIIDYN